MIKKIYPKENWIVQLNDIITNPIELLKVLKLDNNKKLLNSCKARKLFALRVPRSFINRMKKKDPLDPLFVQVFTDSKEFDKILSYNKDPIKENLKIVVPGLIHKYKNRVLLITKNDCAVHCRYCFRRHFPYINNKGNKHNWKQAILYISKNKYINEIILSGGDPLMAKDNEIQWIIEKLEEINHLKILRIHSRLPVVIPSRITTNFCRILKKTRLKIVFVTHINHFNEINLEVTKKIKKIKSLGITVFNQSVLLKGVNDRSSILAKLSMSLFSIGIIPYYLHLLDKVEGAAHFYVSQKKAFKIFDNLVAKISGYMVPKLVSDLPNSLNKNILY